MTETLVLRAEGFVDQRQANKPTVKPLPNKSSKVTMSTLIGASDGDKWRNGRRLFRPVISAGVSAVVSLKMRSRSIARVSLETPSQTGTNTLIRFVLHERNYV